MAAAKAQAVDLASGLRVPRVFSTDGQDPFESVSWATRDAAIRNFAGEAIFEQLGVEFPEAWTPLAVNVVASKYFYGDVAKGNGSPADGLREHSLRQLVHRVTRTIADWGRAGGYFASDADAEAFYDELTWLCTNQFGAFNSPVWFNVGLHAQYGVRDSGGKTISAVDLDETSDTYGETIAVDPYERPQGSACFIISVEDSVDDIWKLMGESARLFKFGSGVGADWSKLRSSHEKLSGGGTPSGPVSFMKVQDATGGTIKSGGKTRRAAIMQTLKSWHPDVLEFVRAKQDEERKAWALIEEGYDGSFNGPAYGSVAFQNVNQSVRLDDAVMQAARDEAPYSLRAVTSGETVETVDARELLMAIAEGTHVCGDPGAQYEDTIQRWHTCKTDGPINSSNPCCVTGDTLVAVADGRNAVPIRDLMGTEVPVYAHDHATGGTAVSRMWNIEVKRRAVPVHRVTLDDGSSFRATDDHLIMLRDGSYRMVRDLAAGDSLMPFHNKVLRPAKTRTRRRYYWTGRGWQPQYRATWRHANGDQPAGHHIHHANFDALNDRPDNLVLMTAEDHMALHGDRMRGDANPARRFMTPTWRRHISEAQRGERNGNFGRTHSDETRRVMREKAAARWASPEAHTKASAEARARFARMKADGRPVGRPRGERFQRCCPVCRDNFETARTAQIFCSSLCRYSPVGAKMVGAKTATANRGRALTAEHRARLSESGRRVADPVVKTAAARAGHRNTVLKAARLLLDNGVAPTIDEWDGLRPTARRLGADRVPTARTVRQHFATDAALCEHAALYNHKVVSVEFCGNEDVYDGTVDTHHNFAILTSADASCVEGTLNYSGVFIHNSEYMFLDDSACNLASLNLRKFQNADGSFDTARYRAAARTFFVAQEILVSNAGYPSERIAANSERYRPLGLGFANLGALLMSMGLPYDSDEGRAVAGALMAIEHCEAYACSAEMAAAVGPFKSFADNREPMLEVMRMHRDAVQTIGASCPAGLREAAQEAADRMVRLGETHGYRNAQATVLAPTGTIGFMMDCDTTGVEPDIALVKYKLLAGKGDGLMKIVNGTVGSALAQLGYSDAEAGEILAFIDAHDTIEGAPYLRDEHLPVFDCAFKPHNGTRSITHTGHIQMMAAVQPFISGAISKTVNLPETATPEDIYDAYMESWELGLKAVAIYRENSKRSQPLSTKKGGNTAGKAEALVSGDGASVEIPEAQVVERIVEKVVYKPVRKRLPDERPSVTHKFSVAGHEGYLHVGLYADTGMPGEIFITMAKQGSTIAGLMDSFATAISLAFQYGVPLDDLSRKFSHVRFEPAGFTTNQQIPIAKSITDYIFRYLSLKFLEAPVPEATADEAVDDDGEAPADPAPHVAAEAQKHGAASDQTQADLFAAGAAPSGAPGSGAGAGSGDGGSGASMVGRTVESFLAEAPTAFRNQEDAPGCPNCGSITVRAGSCYSCPNCGSTTGCG